MSITAAHGFVAAGGHCGLKDEDLLDLAVVATDDGLPVTAAAVFTTNKAPAAPVQVSRAHLAATRQQAVAVVINSGNANAATGGAGRESAEAMCAATATALGCQPEAVLVCSTGLIGIPLPVEKVVAAIPAVVASRSRAGSHDAAKAIMTTDTRLKEALVVEAGLSVGGMAKGAAMLAPNMATMLAILTTDAEATAEELAAVLTDAVDRSFNRLSVDGCTSTNDTVILLASGRSGRPPEGVLQDAVTAVCCDLASQMAGDAEGATKVIEVEVSGAKSEDEALQAARKVAESQLVKCSMFGEDPYWGRVVSELGTAGVDFDPDRVNVGYGSTLVCQAGVAVPFDEEAVRVHLAGRAVRIVVDLGLGLGQATILTNDLTPGYIEENMRTS